MPINYQIVKCTNPKGSEGVEYATNRTKKTGDFTTIDICKEVERSTTCTKADVVAVLTATKEVIKDHILQGQRVVLDELGALQANVNSRCFARAAMGTDSFMPSSYIRSVGIRFRPNADLLRYVRMNRQLKRVPSELMA